MSTQVGVDPFNRFPQAGDICAGKHGGLPTSESAYRRASHGIIKSQQAILELARLAPKGITCKEAAAILSKDMSSVSPRFTELTLEQNLLRRLNETRDGCYVHVLEPVTTSQSCSLKEDQAESTPKPAKKVRNQRKEPPALSREMFVPDELRTKLAELHTVQELCDWLNSELMRRVVIV